MVSSVKYNNLKSKLTVNKCMDCLSETEKKKKSEDLAQAGKNDNQNQRSQDYRMRIIHSPLLHQYHQLHI